MRTVDEWKVILRARLRVAVGTKDRPAMTVLRETLAAIENAEAPPMTHAPAGELGVFAGGVAGLGAGEIERVVLTPEAVLAIIEGEIRERRDAAAQYVGLGRREEAGLLSSQADILAAIVASPASPVT